MRGFFVSGLVITQFSIEIVNFSGNLSGYVYMLFAE